MIKGITAVIGSGGKTTLLRILAEELSGTVILTTSTHILPFAGIPLLVTDDIEQVRRALALHRVICMGTPAAEGKLTAPSLPFSVLADAADYVIVEADGSKRLPLKAHASHEPVIPENTPVSYTHLDVYKRQILLTAFSRSVSTRKTPSMSEESSILPSFVSLLRMLAF